MTGKDALKKLAAYQEVGLGRAIRELSLVSRNEMGARIGVSGPAIGRWESQTGEQRLPQSGATAIKYATELDRLLSEFTRKGRRR